MRWPVILLALAGLAAGCLDGGTSHGQSTPSWQQAFLVSNPLPGLIIEIDAVAGVTPSAAALNGFKARMEGIVQKQDLKILPVQEIPSPGSLDAQQTRAFALEHRDTGSGSVLGDGTNAVLHVLFLDDDRSDFQGEAAGTYFGFGIIGIYPNSWRLQGGLAFDDRFMLEVMTHEAGHAFGLVNDGIPMQRNHEDSESRGHSSNPKSVMERTVGLVAIFPEQVPPLDDPREAYDFDEDDLADIRAFQARLA